MNEIIIFEENLTAAGLQKIQEESKSWPVKAETKQQYETIYAEHQRFKRLRLAVTKKKTELTKTEKQKFESEKVRISTDYDFVMSVLAPLEKQLSDSRQEWDDRKKAEAEEKAKIEAAKQKAEFERQEFIRNHTEAIQDNIYFNEETKRKEKLAKEEAERKAAADERERLLKIEADRLEKIETERQAAADEKEKQQEENRLKLERDRYEFECEKSRLSFDDAWGEAYPGPILNADMFDSDAISENQEARHDLESNMKMSHMIKDPLFADLEDHKILHEPKTPLQKKQDGEYAPDVFAAQAKPEPVKLFSLADYEAIKTMLKNSGDLIGQLIAIQEAGIKNTELNIEISNFLNRVKSAKRIFSNKYENLI